MVTDSIARVDAEMADSLAAAWIRKVTKSQLGAEHEVRSGIERVRARVESDAQRERAERLLFASRKAETKGAA